MLPFRPAMGLLDGGVAVVTGSGRGIGHGIALELAREGAQVVVNDAGVEPDGRGGSEDPAAATCRDIEAAGGKAVPNYDDVSRFESAEPSSRPPCRSSAASTSW